jgi:hypothetical protein
MSRKIDNPARYRYEGRVIKIFSFWGVFAALLVWKGHLTGILAYALAVLLSLPLVGLMLFLACTFEMSKTSFCAIFRFNRCSGASERHSL